MPSSKQKREATPRSGLPHGARRLGIGPATIAFGRDKIVIPFPGDNRHLTIQFGSASGVLDIHSTNESRDDARHTPLFSITHDGLADAARVGVPDIVASLRRIIRPLRLGWMARQGMVAVLGLDIAEAEWEDITVVRRGKLIVDPDRVAARLRVPEFIEDLLNLPDGASFTLVSWRDPRHPRRLGTGFRMSARDTQPRFVWIKDRDAWRFARTVRNVLTREAAMHGEFHAPLPWF